jgi:hypothetical protein
MYCIHKKQKVLSSTVISMHHFQQKRDSRQVALGFTYRFSKGKVGGAKRRTSGASDEQKPCEGRR